MLCAFSNVSFENLIDNKWIRPTYVCLKISAECRKCLSLEWASRQPPFSFSIFVQPLIDGLSANIEWVRVVAGRICTEVSHK